MAAMKRFYENNVLPHLINVAMSTKAMKEERQRCLEHVKGTVLEVGFGTGLNLPHYPRTVTKVVGIDPSDRSARIARKRIAAAPFPIEIIGLSAEKIPVADTSFESIVSTFTMCDSDVGAPRDARAASRGWFLFREHGLAKDPKVERWQRRLNRCSRWSLRVPPNRPISALIEQAGLRWNGRERLSARAKFGGFIMAAKRP
jgi:hypothetical protein